MTFFSTIVLCALVCMYICTNHVHALDITGRPIFIQPDDYKDIADPASFFQQYSTYQLTDKDLVEVVMPTRTVFNPHLQDIVQNIAKELLVHQYKHGGFVDDIFYNTSIVAALTKRGYIVGAAGDIMPAHIQDLGQIRAYYGLPPLNDTGSGKDMDIHTRSIYMDTRDNFLVFDDDWKDWCLSYSGSYYANINCGQSDTNRYRDAVWTGQCYSTYADGDRIWNDAGCNLGYDLYLEMQGSWDSSRSDRCNDLTGDCSGRNSGGYSYRYQLRHVMTQPKCVYAGTIYCVSNYCNCVGGNRIWRSYRDSSDKNKRDFCTGVTPNCMNQANYNEVVGIGYSCLDYSLPSLPWT